MLAAEMRPLPLRSLRAAALPNLCWTARRHAGLTSFSSLLPLCSPKPVVVAETAQDRSHSESRPNLERGVGSFDPSACSGQIVLNISSSESDRQSTFKAITAETSAAAENGRFVLEPAVSYRLGPADVLGENGVVWF
jgi:hypothetical protein